MCVAVIIKVDGVPTPLKLPTMMVSAVTKAGGICNVISFLPLCIYYVVGTVRSARMRILGFVNQLNMKEVGRVFIRRICRN